MKRQTLYRMSYQLSNTTPNSTYMTGNTYNAGDLGSIPGSGISPGEGNGNPLQYSYLENPTDGGPW